MAERGQPTVHAKPTNSCNMLGICFFFSEEADFFWLGFGGEAAETQPKNSIKIMKGKGNFHKPFNLFLSCNKL